MAGPVLLALLLSLEAPPPAPVADPMASEAMRSDARLHDVCFVDPQRGWAVGDRGTIWHTEDGGRGWHLQPSGVGCPLESVCFVTDKIGWAAGGFSHPYTHTSTGVLLATRDGGRRWHHDPGALLPALKRVRFFSDKHGWAIGCPSAMFPTGVFTTDNGGRSWNPLAGEKLSAWLAADFLDPNTGTLAGRNGSVATVQRGGIQPARMGSFGLRNLTGLKLVAPVHGWLVGDGGLVMMTGDLGTSWQTPPGAVPQDVVRHFDFAALAVRGPKCWIAGSPGTRVLHTPDAGRTWHSFNTGTHLPIHGLWFTDDQHGWAVGALGTILATADGGQTWRRQRCGGTRAALLGMFGTARDVPLELFARLSGNDGYLGVVEVLNRRDVEVKPRDQVHPADRVQEALVAVGASEACTAWRFPLRQPGLELGADEIIEGWDRANDARGLTNLEAHVVRQIRLWRPEVIVTHNASPQGKDPRGHLVNQVVLQAVQKAADPTSLPEQITHAGLPPWKVKKVYAALPSGRQGSTDLTTAQLATRLGRSLADAATMPRSLLEDRFRAAPQTLGFRLLVNHLPQQQGRRDFFSGIVLRSGGEARRELIEPPPGSFDRLRQIAQRRRNLHAILDQSEDQPGGSPRLLAQTAELTRGLDGPSAGRILYHLGQQYYRTGRWPLAAETFELLARRHPDHPLSGPTLLWLVQYHAGSETAWRVQGPQRLVMGQGSGGGSQGFEVTPSPRHPVTPSPRHPFGVVQASALSADTSPQEEHWDRAVRLGKQIEQARPAMFAEEKLRFSLASAQRNQGFPQQAQRYFLTRSRSAARDAWWACAQAEVWLAEPKGQPPKPVLQCAAARSKPRLDGRLDDSVWNRAKPAKLRSMQQDDGQWPAAVMLAYDAEFLYLAISCRRAPGAKYETTEGPRPRDPDLSGEDRVDVLLDIDRDYGTYYRLTVDHRGWTGEGCWGDATWNPTWFVAADTTDGVWTAEAAVPLDQLSGRYPTSRQVWALGIQRTIPSVGFQSWTTPAAVEVIPEGFGYLIFD